MSSEVANLAQMRELPDIMQLTNSPAELSATEFLKLLARRDISVLEYVRACADRIEEFDPAIMAWKYFDRNLLENRARMIDEEGAVNKAIGRMTGIPVGVKDIFNTYDMPTGMGSKILENYTPGNDARIVSNIRQESGLIVGKTITAEFAVHHPGPTLNPWDSSRSPGTSSSGSAAAVAARMVPVSIASQTSGSIIRPASYCGIAGFKPSFGLIPRTGVLKTTDTLDSLGFMARTVDDLQMLFEVARVRGRNYPISEAALNDTERQELTGRPWRIGLVQGPKSDQEDPKAKAAFDSFASKLPRLGFEVSEFILPPNFEIAHDTHETIYRRALAYYFTLEWNAHANLFSDSLREMISGGLKIAPEEYHAATQTQVMLSRQFDQVAQEVDVLIGLSTADVAPEALLTQEPDDHCLIWTMCGAPSISLPLLRGKNELPIGVQITARRFDDYKLLTFAKVLEGSNLT